MSYMKLKPSLELTPAALAQSNQLRDLLAKARLHQQAEKYVLDAAPDNFKSGLRFVSYHEGELVLTTSTAIQASQLRFRQQELMARLREHEMFQYVWKVRIKVSPARHSTRKPAAPMVLSKENARLLKEEAGHTKDQALREVLEKLASHASGRSD